MDKSEISIHASDNSLSELTILLLYLEKHDLIFLQIRRTTTKIQLFISNFLFSRFYVIYRLLTCQSSGSRNLPNEKSG